MKQVYCEGRGLECSTPNACKQHCKSLLITADSGRRIDTHADEAPSAPMRRTFEPDYGIEHAPALPWYQRVPPLKYFVCVGAIVGLVYGLVR